MSQDIYRRIGSRGVIPIIAIDSVDAALPLADALLEGGLPVAEITFRTEAAAAVITKLSSERPELMLGAGTILTVDNLKRARDCGAAFGVAPGLNPDVVREALAIGFPFAPGVMTPSDVEAALATGLKVLKFFPAEVAGGVKMLKALAGPYGHTGVQFLPTGGVGAANFHDYLALDTVLAVGGSWVARRDAIAAGDWTTVAANCRQICQAMEA